MPLYEVFIPTADPDGFNITARIRAESWIQALRNGLSKLGDSADVRNIMCDITETGIDVTEPKSGRVFRIRELEEGAGGTPGAPSQAAPPEASAPATAAPPPAASAPPPVAAGAPPAAAPPIVAPPPAAPSASARPAGAPPPAAPSAPARPAAAPPPAAPSAPARPAAAPPPAAPSAESAAPAAPAPQAQAPAGETQQVSAAAVPDEPRQLGEQTAVPPGATQPPPVAPSEVQAVPPPSETPKTAQPLGEPFKRFADVGEEESITQEKASKEPAERIGRVREEEKPVEDLIGDLFEATQELYSQPDVRAAARYLLKVAHDVVPSESGAVFIADINRQDLYFAAATGPKADEVVEFRVPMGQGIVGFSAQEGVALAVSDVHRDPRFYAKISKKLGYETKSILCSPAQQEGRVFGAVELINKKNGSSFTGDEVNLVNYLAHEFAEYLINTGQTGD